MTISANLNDKIAGCIIESTAVPGQPAVIVVNPDGSSVGGGGAQGNPVLTGGSDGTVTRSLATNILGQQYAVPVVPDLSGDHPPNELGLYGFTSASPLPAPGAGKRYRLFGIYPQMQTTLSSFYISIIPASGSGSFLGFGGQTSATYPPSSGITFPLSGLPLATNTGIQLQNGVGTNACAVLATIETV